MAFHDQQLETIRKFLLDGPLQFDLEHLIRYRRLVVLHDARNGLRLRLLRLCRREGGQSQGKNRRLSHDWPPQFCFFDAAGAVPAAGTVTITTRLAVRRYALAAF